MHVIFKDSHDSVVVEERYPMEERIQKSLRISIESLADTVNGHMIVYKFDAIFTWLKNLADEVLLETIKTVQIAWIENHVGDLSPLEI